MLHAHLDHTCSQNPAADKKGRVGTEGGVARGDLGGFMFEAGAPCLTFLLLLQETGLYSCPQPALWTEFSSRSSLGLSLGFSLSWCAGVGLYPCGFFLCQLTARGKPQTRQLWWEYLHHEN